MSVLLDLNTSFEYEQIKIVKENDLVIESKVPSKFLIKEIADLSKIRKISLETYTREGYANFKIDY